MSNCIFCKIIANPEIPKLFENEDMVIIKDISPKAKHHYLAIPKKHYATLADMDNDDAVTLGKCLKKIPELAEQLHLTGGYRLVVNQGKDAGQTVWHLHIHILVHQTEAF